MSEPTQSLFKLQLGPVQDFIAQARSTRDLWSGSYLLSWLMAAGIRKLLESEDVNLIYPSQEGQLLLGPRDQFRDLVDDDAQRLLIANLPNIFVASVPADRAKDLADQTVEAIKAEWKAIAEAVWGQHDKLGIDQKMEERFFAQVDRHLSVAWMVTRLDGDYADAYRHNGWHLDAVRQVRDFRAWDSAWGPGEKDSLSGREEALVGGSDYRDKMADQGGELSSLFGKHADHLGAVAIIKRCWHLAYLRPAWGMGPALKRFSIRSIPAIAARKDDHVDDAPPQEQAKGDKYVAAIAFDGDKIGSWVNGDMLKDKSRLAGHHGDFSAALSDFAMKRVRGIVERQENGTGKDEKAIQVPLGQLIYAGGDDVVALVPADEALKVALDLRKAFCEATKDTPTDDRNVKPDASAGIAIAHIHSPLQDLIREAQAAEKRAKNEVGRPAFSITLMKRSGEISHWGANWRSEAGGIALFNEMAALMRDRKLSARFPHRVCQLLEPYVTVRAASSQITDVGGIDSDALIKREFYHAIERQSSSGMSQANLRALQGPLDIYLDTIRKEHADQNSNTSLLQTQLAALIGLCTTVAFAERNRPNTGKETPTPTAERQPTA